MIFRKLKICRARAWRKLTIFWNWTPKNIPDQQKCVGFQNSKKVLNHSTLLWSVQYTLTNTFVRYIVICILCVQYILCYILCFNITRAIFLYPVLCSVQCIVQNLYTSAFAPPILVYFCLCANTGILLPLCHQYQYTSAFVPPIPVYFCLCDTNTGILLPLCHQCPTWWN